MNKPGVIGPGRRRGRWPSSRLDGDAARAGRTRLPLGRDRRHVPLRGLSPRGYAVVRPTTRSCTCCTGCPRASTAYTCARLRRTRRRHAHADRRSSSYRRARARTRPIPSTSTAVPATAGRPRSPPSSTHVIDARYRTIRSRRGARSSASRRAATARCTSRSASRRVLRGGVVERVLPSHRSDRHEDPRPRLGRGKRRCRRAHAPAGGARDAARARDVHRLLRRPGRHALLRRERAPEPGALRRRRGRTSSASTPAGTTRRSGSGTPRPGCSSR